MGQKPAGIMGYRPLNFMYFDDPMKELAISTGPIIRQEIEMYEAVKIKFVFGIIWSPQTIPNTIVFKKIYIYGIFWGPQTPWNSIDFKK